MFFVRSTGRLLAVGLALLLLSCGCSHYTVNPRAEDLTQFVLIIEEVNGQVSHSWQRAADFDLSSSFSCSRGGQPDGGIVLAAARPWDCDQEQIDCYRNCMKNRLPSNLDHIQRNDGGKSRHCATVCLEEYTRCLKLQSLNAVEFSSSQGAAEWLKRNRTGVLVGSVVVIAGVAFVTLSAGAGLIVLAPLVLVAG